MSILSTDRERTIGIVSDGKKLQLHIQGLKEFEKEASADARSLFTRVLVRGGVYLGAITLQDELTGKEGIRD